ncbi:hypothetical protein [Herbaspirillum robiniae]|uniref:Uncharacterized protein n=1 Tax=Herbaspirillum robiniae TaxID=2014887 RepID=A0ABX2M1V8_9BURK|nr:hypothetical protein [Herbaspirillum robiniae]NUU04654.1 hypothetical protein [Herbaspirillum robiniae]
MKSMIGWLTAAAISASPCAWDTSQRELAERMNPTALLSQATPSPAASSTPTTDHH